MQLTSGLMPAGSQFNSLAEPRASTKHGNHGHGRDPCSLFPALKTGKDVLENLRYSCIAATHSSTQIQHSCKSHFNNNKKSHMHSTSSIKQETPPPLRAVHHKKRARVFRCCCLSLSFGRAVPETASSYMVVLV